jgi:hypothetical protein
MDKLMILFWKYTNEEDRSMVFSEKEQKNQYSEFKKYILKYLVNELVTVGDTEYFPTKRMK